ncbi:MAG: retroviral-like aspartic protease family protein, partial [Planctomycetota bacterium]|nr:retroviral-like aspartic protease family protein [Planctomycetota bacterium]
AHRLSPKGHVWATADDLVLQRRLNTLDFLVRQVRESEGRVGQVVARNEAFRTELEQIDVALQEARTKESNDPQTTKRIELLVNKRDTLQEKFLPPEEFSSDDTVRDEVVQLIGRRQQLSLSVHTTSAEVSRVEEIYAGLNKDPEITAALAALGKSHRLAGGRLLKQYQDRISQAQRAAAGRWVPLYRVAGSYRVPLLVEERAPVTMTYQPGSGPGLLPDSVRRRAGIDIPQDARQTFYRAADGREIPVRVVEVAYLQLGPYLLEKVPFYVLPPEAEDLGGRITDETLAGYAVRAVPHRLRLVLGTGN